MSAVLTLALALAALAAVAALTDTLLFTDARYAAMTRAVATSAARYGAVEVVALDDDACASFADLPCEPVNPLRRGRYSDYFSTIAPRLVHVRDLLFQTEWGSRGRGLFVLDSDVVLFRNVGARAERLGADLVFQRELPCAEPPPHPCLCAGVWWVNTSSLAALWTISRAVRLMAALALPDQDALQIAVAENVETEGLRVAYLDADRHPNGFVHAANADRLEASRVHLVHANWAPDVAAKERRLADLRRAYDAGQRWLPPAADANSSAVCAQLRALDAANLAAVLNCTSGRAAATRLKERCA